MGNGTVPHSRPWFLAMVAALLVLIAVAAGMFWFANPGAKPQPARSREPKPAATHQVAGMPLPPKESPAVTPGEVSEDASAPTVEESRGPGGVMGTVRWPDAMPAPGAEVVVKRVPVSNEPASGADELLGSGTTDADGAFLVAGLPYAWMSVEARHGQACAFHLIIDTPATPVSQVDLMLQEGGLLAGVVVNRDAAPVSGALLRGYARSDGQEESSYVPQGITTGTDETGKFRFELLPKEAWRFRVGAPGYAALVTDLLRVGTEANRIVLEREGKLMGLAHLRPQGQAAAHLGVRAALRGKLKLVFEAKTAEDGRFEIAGLPTGTYDLLSTDKRYYAEPCEVSVTEGQAAPEADLWLSQAGSIVGRVYDIATRIGLPHVQVGAGAPGGSTGAHDDTAADGSFELVGLAPGTYKMNLSQNSHRFAESGRIPRVSLGPGARVQVDIPIECGVVIAGEVVDADGKPVANAEVSANSAPLNSQTCSDAAGAFVLFGFSPDTLVTIRARYGVWRNRAIEPIEVPAEGIRGLRLVLDQKRNSSIAGTVTDVQGRRLQAGVTALPEELAEFEGTAVTRRPSDGRSPRQLAYVREASVRSDEEGRFLLAPLIPGTYALRVSVESRRRILATIALRDGEHRTGVALVWTANEGLAISGHVTESDGGPVAGAVVRTSASFPDSEMVEDIRGTTDAEGAYVLAGLPAGDYTLLVEHQGFYAEQDRQVAAAGSEGVDFVVHAKLRVTGQAIDRRTGRPVPDYTYRVVDTATGQRVPIFSDGMSPHNSAYERTATGIDGRFEWSGMAHPHELSIVAHGYASCTQAVDLSGGRSIDNLSVPLDRSAAAVEGVVTDADGIPVAGARIHQGAVAVSYDTQIGPALALTDPDGRFVIETGADRLTVVSALHPNYAPAAGTLEGEPDGVRTITLVMDLAAAIEGRVTLDGRPYAGAAIELNKDDGITNTGGLTDDDGVYANTGIPPGAYDVACELLSDDPAIRAIAEQHKQIQVGAGGTATADFEFHSRQKKVAATPHRAP